MRVIRILVYEGDESIINETMKRNGVKKYYEVKGMRISEAMIGYEYPQVTDENNNE